MAVDGAPAAGLPTDTRYHVLYSIIGTLVPFTVMIVGMRVYSRHFLSNTFGIDDWMTLVSTVFYLITCFIMIGEIQAGLGSHKWTLTDSQIMQYYKVSSNWSYYEVCLKLTAQTVFYVDIIFYITALGLIKLHILLQYFRIFSVKMKRITVWVTVISCLWTTGSVLSCIFICNPVAGFWDPSLNPVCITPMVAQWYTNAAGNIITDIIIFALPIKVLWCLNLPLGQRISLLGVFCLGFLTVAISTIRISFLTLEADDTYQNISPASWSVAELSSGMIASCLPCMRPLLYKIAPSLRSVQATDHGPAIRTIGGGYIGSSSGGSRPKSLKSKATMEGSHVTASRRGSSTLDLTNNAEDIELGLGAAKSQEGETYLENISSESISESDEQMLPMQRPPETYPSYRHPGSALAREEFLGLRSATLTTIRASPEPPVTAGHQLRRSSGGIQIIRDVVQKSGPVFP